MKMKTAVVPAVIMDDGRKRPPMKTMPVKAEKMKKGGMVINRARIGI